MMMLVEVMGTELMEEVMGTELLVEVMGTELAALGMLPWHRLKCRSTRYCRHFRD